MYISHKSDVHHLKSKDWLYTAQGDNRGFIQPQKLTELWFHTGSNCNLRCPFCFEGSAPGDIRLQAPNLTDVYPFLLEATALQVQQLAFTGGEPFVNKHMVDILDASLDVAPCLVLTNGTEPLHRALPKLSPFRHGKHTLSFRISLDAPDAALHDKNRGQGSFHKALQAMVALHERGFPVMVAHQRDSMMNAARAQDAYMHIFAQYGLPQDISLVSFPDLLRPCAKPDVPHISEHCMVQYKTQSERESFMCNYSKMIVKTQGRMAVYACTLVDDDTAYDLGDSLTQAMQYRIMLRHHRCYSCFAAGTSCSAAG